MCSEIVKIFLGLSLVLAASCSMNRKLSGIAGDGIMPGISIPYDGPENMDYGLDDAGDDVEGAADSMSSDDGSPVIMNAIRDTETGEMVATDVIRASKVTARFRNVAERAGKITMEFDIEVPAAVMDSRWKLKFTPEMDVMGDVSCLEPLYITGSRYRERQLRGYERYRAFIASIITDSADFIRIGQLEKFLMRYYPQTYSMKNDTSFISDPVAENIFGVSQKEALEHYTRHGMIARNDARGRNAGMMFRKYVRDPLPDGGFRLDTVLVSPEGGLTYRYVQSMSGFPGLRKIIVSLDGEILEDGRSLISLPSPEPLVFYVSSLSSLADNTPKYKTRVLYRTVYDNTRAFIDFRQGSAEVDTLISGNASEIRRIRACIKDMSSSPDFVLDSMMVSASCSPEGQWDYNAKLAAERSGSVLEYFRQDFPDSLRSRLRSSSVPENWQQFIALVSADTVIAGRSRDRILSLSSGRDKDSVETAYQMMPEYRYLREKVYPRLRSVKFEFWLHRPDMEKDTVHTSELDTAYMRGVEAIRNLDYRDAMAILQPYEDYNSALACLSAGYEETALSILSRMKHHTAASFYLAAVALSRLGETDKAMDFYRESVALDPAMRHRANLDPEISGIARRYEHELPLL